jgi:hypothetical protein
MLESRPPSTAIYTTGAIFLVYGAGEALVVLLLSLVGLQGANENTVVLPSFVFAPVIPALLILTGWALMRGWFWGYRTALLLPVLIVPLAIWVLGDPAPPPTPGSNALQLVAVGAVLGLGSVALSLALGFLWLKSLRVR